MNKHKSLYWIFYSLSLLIYSILQSYVFRHNFWNPDEGYLLTEARMLNNGEHFYETVVDRKTPLLPLLYYFVAKFSQQDTMLVVHGVFVLIKLISVFFLYKISFYFTDNRYKQLAVIPIYLLMSLCLPATSSMAANFESLTSIFILGSYFALLRGRYFALGISAALAFLAEQRALFFLIHIALFIIIKAIREKSYKIIALPLFSFVLTFLPFLKILLKKSAFFWIFKASNNYINPLQIIRFDTSNLIITQLSIVFILSIVVIIARISTRKRLIKDIKDTSFLIWYTVCGFVAILSTFHFFNHYFIYLLPQLALFSALMLERVWLFLQLALLITTATVLISTDSKPTSLENKLVLIGYISEQATNKNDKVIFWTMRPEIYSYANRLPGTRFLTPGFVFNYSSIVDTHYVATKYGIKNGEKILLEDIRSSKPKIIVDYCNSKDNEICSLQLIPGVREILKNYRVIAIVEDAIIYERNT